MTDREVSYDGWWAQNPKIKTADDYIDSLRSRDIEVFLLGQRVESVVDNPIIFPSINAMAETYRLAEEDPDLASPVSPLTGGRINRFLHINECPDDLVQKHEMQRVLGQRTGTCFQRCVGLDAINALHSVTFDIDKKHGTDYAKRFLAFLTKAQDHNVVLGGAMTDPKGDRLKAPHEQTDPDLFLHVTHRTERGVFVSGAKMHQTGCINSHWIIFMPTMRMREADRDYAIVGAIPADAPGLKYIYGRQANDTRSLDGGEIDAGNAKFAGQEAMIVFEDVFVPNELIFTNGEYDHSADLVERFTAYHRSSYVCKTGLGDVLIGAAAEAADLNGVAKVSHIKDKLVEMTHLNETIYSCSIASAYKAQEMESGVWQNDTLLANICKHNVTRFPYEISRLAQDIAGGLMVTMPSQKDLENNEIGDLMHKFLQGRDGTSTLDRMKVLRLIENITLGRNAVGYLTESMHGAGSPQAQRILIAKLSDMDAKKSYAKALAGIEG